MANTRISQVSFSRGEFCPPLYMRTDISQYHIGLKTLKNGFVQQEGCVSNRSGLEFVGEIKDSSKVGRLIPFVFNSEQTYIIEAGEKYFRFIQEGGYIVYPNDYGILFDGEFTYVGSETNENEVTYHEYTLNEVSYYASEQIVENLIFYKDTLLENEYGTVQAFNLEESTVTIINDDKIALRNQIVELETPYQAEDLRYLKFAQSADILTITHIDYAPKELIRYDHHEWELKDIIFAPSITAPTGIRAEWTGSTSSNARDYTYCVTAVDKETLEESESSEEVTTKGHREAYWTTSEYMTITWDEVEGAQEYNVYRSVNGVMGYLGTAKTNSFTDDNIEPDLAETAPILKNPFENENHPSCCAYFQQRKIYANTYNSPQMIYASQTATSNNFNSSRPLIASDAVELPLADREVNEIRHLVPFKDLIALTTNSEYKINGTDGKFEANPMPVAVIQSAYGASHVQPIVSGSMVVFVEAGGNVLRELGYDYLSDSYNGDELSLFASHLFEGKEIIYIGYAKAPYRLIYVIFRDGTLAVLSYNKKQELCGWGRFETEGSFESVACIREGLEDVAYFIVKRNINGQDVRYIERTTTRIVKNAKTGFFVDSGLSAQFEEAVDNISGLGHLANCEVVALCDGGVVEKLVVDGEGKVILPYPTKDLVIGLPYEFEFETLGVEGENTHGLKKIINSITVNVLNSREDFFVVGNTGKVFQNGRNLDSINDSGLLYSGKVEATPLNTPTDRATIHLAQRHPLPLTITAVSAIVNSQDVQDTE